jgi:hypothetical protein
MSSLPSFGNNSSNNSPEGKGFPTHDGSGDAAGEDGSNGTSSEGNNGSNGRSEDKSDSDGECQGQGENSCTIGSEGGGGSEEIVLKIFGKAGTGYLRTTVAAVYEGRQWTIEPDYTVVPYDGGYIQQSINLYTTSIQSAVSIQPANSWSGFVPVVFPTNRLALTEQIQTEYYPQQQIFFAMSTFLGSYDVEFTHYEFDEEILKSSRTAPEKPAYLEIPQTLQERVQVLLNEINYRGFQMIMTKFSRLRTTFSLIMHTI